MGSRSDPTMSGGASYASMSSTTTSTALSRLGRWPSVANPATPISPCALANAYFTRKRRSWDKLDGSEIKRIVTLMEQILRQDPSNDADLRMWFQAYRRDPGFNVIIALARLEGWAARSDSRDAHYYLYILHYLNFRDGTEIDESLVDAAYVVAASWQRASVPNPMSGWPSPPNGVPWPISPSPASGIIGSSFTPGPPTFAASRAPSRLTRLPRAARFVLASTSTAFFVPSQAIGTPNLNEIVSFYLGFSYDGFRAWKVELETAGTERPAPRDDEEKARAAVVAPEVIACSNVAAQREPRRSTDPRSRRCH